MRKMSEKTEELKAEKEKKEEAKQKELEDKSNKAKEELECITETGIVNESAQLEKAETEIRKLVKELAEELKKNSDDAGRADEAYEKFKQNEGKHRWEFANNVLYDLCKNNREHIDEHKIVAKIWLIGRSYAAAVDRRPNINKDDGDFHYDKVAPMIQEHGELLDDQIEKLNNSEFSYSRSFYVHEYLTLMFTALTALEKRSLASKYLHFHCNEVIIYDSKTSAAIKKLVKIPRNTSQEINGLFKNIKCDLEYVRHCLRVLALRDYIKSEHKTELSARQIDTLLFNAEMPIDDESKTQGHDTEDGE